MLSAKVERNKQTVRKLFDEVINTGRLDLCDRYLAPDRVDHQDYGMPAGSSNGHDGFQRTLGVFLEGFPDLHLTIDFIIADEDRVAAYVTTEGTHTGSFMGVPATGKRFSVKGTDIFAFNEAGLVSDHWGAFDALGMMRQLGFMSAAQPPRVVEGA